LDDDDDANGYDDNRQGCGKALLDKHSHSNSFSRDDMIGILRDHRSGICMHGSDGFGFKTTESMVSELFVGGSSSPQHHTGGGPENRDKPRNKHWTTGPCPCRSTFCLQEI